jgi:hypothetical protein
MRAATASGEITLTDSPAIFWLLGLFFCGLGFLALLAVRSSLRQADPLWEILLPALLGLAAITAGLWIIYAAPASRVTLRPVQGEITLRRRGLLQNATRRIAFADIVSAYLVQGKDIDGGPVYTLRLMLTTGEEVPLTRLWIHNRAGLEQALETLAPYLPVKGVKIAP